MKKIKVSSKAKKIIESCICIVLLIGVVVAVFFGGYYTKETENKTYTVYASVKDITNDEIFFETQAGHIFSIVTNEIFAYGEQYTITFDSCDTATVEDDIIVLISREINM